MTESFDLSTLRWSLTGWRPHAWQLAKSAEPAGLLTSEIGPLRAHFPGSVQQNLLDAGLVPDWNVGLNSRALEWVEHRHWMFSAVVPEKALRAKSRLVFQAETLDHRGWVVVDGRIVAEFRGAHRPVQIDLTGALRASGMHRLAIVFDQPPEEEGQLGYTSRARSFEPRFSYGWDWGVRFVPIGARGRLELVRDAALAVTLLGVRTSLGERLDRGQVRVAVAVVARSAHLTVELRRAGEIVASRRRKLKPGAQALKLAIDSPELWWPAGEGSPALYEVRVHATVAGRIVATWTREVGFKQVSWRRNTGAPADALPWICVVNHRRVFLQGVNWTPVRLDYLEARPAEVRGLVAQYRKLGCNLLRVWGGAGLETAEFYAACDRAGLMVWQEFPLSSSGMDSCPPEDVAFVAEAAAIARHFVRARQHHASLLLWCGGNELHRTADGTPGGARRPLEASHPVLAALAEVVATEDPGRRFLPTSPFGPRFGAARDEFGRGVHHAVHGPWGLDEFASEAEWESYWRDDDALFRAEVGVAGASDAALIARFAGHEPPWPPTKAYWQHTAAWWAQWERLRRRIGSAPAAEALPRYVALTQREQAEYLARAARLTKEKFPACGGFLVWMGHDAFPCPANTSIIDFERKLKPAAHALAAVFRSAT